MRTPNGRRGGDFFVRQELNEMHAPRRYHHVRSLMHRYQGAAKQANVMRRAHRECSTMPLVCVRAAMPEVFGRARPEVGINTQPQIKASSGTTTRQRTAPGSGVANVHIVFAYQQTPPSNEAVAAVSIVAKPRQSGTGNATLNDLKPGAGVRGAAKAMEGVGSGRARMVGRGAASAPNL